MEVTSGRKQGTARRTSAAKRNNVQWTRPLLPKSILPALAPLGAGPVDFRQQLQIQGTSQPRLNVLARRESDRRYQVAFGMK